ncbi:MAG: SprT family zinc-dependent metalloprotease, partial [Syntrophales bacterium]|nr:SprT family zinc-dependent metalloprotease [Syntrophales bacterium]
MDYRVRISPRSRKVRLNLSACDGLTVVIPRGFDARRIPAIVEARKEWIEKHLRRFSEEARVVSEKPPDLLPDTIDLPALEEIWHIAYRPTGAQRAVEVETFGPGALVVSGAVHDHAACRSVLKRWLRRRAAEELPPLLARLAEENGFRYNRVTIRSQKTRWGSCSARKTISLNCHLLLLPLDVVRYVLLHELCHTAFMNHS